MKPKAVLFDLDGTLADTAPDLALALTALQKPGSAPVDMAKVREATAIGTQALLTLGLGITPSSRDYEDTRRAFLGHYERLIGTAAFLTPGMADVLKTLAARGLPWGVVTNKPEILALRVLQALGLGDTSACLVGGDTTEHRKPHPDPLLSACGRLGLAPQECVYIGDDQNDIIAAHAAGMRGFAAAFGYTSYEEASRWAADAVLAQPGELLALIL